MNQDPIRLAMVMSNFDELGVQRVVLNLYKHFDRRRIVPTLVLWQRRGKIATFLPEDASVYETDLNLPWPRFVFRLPRYVQILTELQPQAILSFVPGTNVSMAMVKPLLRNSPVLIGCEHAFLTRAFALNEYRGPFRLLYQSILRRMYNDICERVIMTAESGRDDAVHNWQIDPNKIEIIYNPQDLADLRRRAAESIDDDPWFSSLSVPVFIAAGRLAQQKGFDLLIEAFARLRKQREARLVILGSGPLERELKRQVAMAGLSHDVRFLGFQINHVKYIKRATGFVLSSRWEAMPMVVGEAMAIGTPVVSFDCPSGPRELLDGGRSGFLVPDQDVDALAQTLGYVIEHPQEVTAKVKRAFERVQLFDVERVTRQYEALIESEVARKSAVRA